jgi:hypothetical protein
MLGVFNPGGEMLRVLISIVLLGLFMGSAFAGSAFAQEPDTTATAPPPAAEVTAQTPPAGVEKESIWSRMYFGGTVGLSFGDYFRISVQPLVGYRVTPKFSVGGKVGYEYIKDKRYSETFTSNNYGGSVFSRYRIVPPVYAHGEFAYISYEYKTSEVSSDRSWVPFLFLGGGYVQSMGRNASVFFEVLFDVLQSDKSPYKDWEPFISVGVGVGF